MNDFDQAGRLGPAKTNLSRVSWLARGYEPGRAMATIFRAGLVCGVLDISAAFMTWSFYDVRPFRILQAIASGLLGPQSYRGGWPTALLGAACHFFIAFFVATVFYMLSRKWNFLTQHAIVAGVSYGIGVYVVMYGVAMPLSRLQRMPFSGLRTSIAIVTHIFCVGLPISLITSRYSRS